MDIELTEEQFWNMSIAELEHYAKSYRRRYIAKAKEKAQYDYMLADLIGASIGRLFSNSAKYPNICEAYPLLFEEEQKEMDERKAELSAARFKQFASSFNNKFKKEEPINE